jgi:pantoate--beta-alanine ligase
MDVNIVPVETMRDNLGLALSSRNEYLSAEEKSEALKIPSALKKATSLVVAGVYDSQIIINEMKMILAPLDVSYIAIVNREFMPISKVETGKSMILVEAVVGNTRLLDNIWL